MDHNNRGNQLTLLLLLCCYLTASVAYYQQSCAGKTLLRSGGLTCSDRQVIVDAHNKARQNVALGHIPGQPAATTMLEMVWDEGLAVVAQRWADKCTIAHDGARDDARFPVGQNIAVTWTTRTNSGPAPDFPRQVKSWFNEVRNFGFYTTGFSKGTGHYSQLVWGDTFLVGCGYSHYYDSSRGYTKLYVCNYGPGGNIVGSRPYSAGNPSCSGQGVRSSQRYQGLCEMSGYPTLGTSCRSTSPYGNSGTTSYTSQGYSTRPFAAYTKQPYSTPSQYTKQPYSTPSQYTKQPYSTPSQYTKQPYSTPSQYTKQPYSTPSQYTKQPYSTPSQYTKQPYSTPSQYTKQPYSTPSQYTKQPFSTPSQYTKQPFSTPSQYTKQPFSTPSQYTKQPFSTPSQYTKQPFSTPSQYTKQPFSIQQQYTKQPFSTQSPYTYSTAVYRSHYYG